MQIFEERGKPEYRAGKPLRAKKRTNKYMMTYLMIIKYSIACILKIIFHSFTLVTGLGKKTADCLTLERHEWLLAKLEVCEQAMKIQQQ